MIVTNWIAKVIVKAASIITPGTLGVTIWPFIFIYPKKYRASLRLIRHENKHLEQYRRYWVVGFLPLYIYYHIRFGYRLNPLEIEARDAETGRTQICL